MKRLLKTGLITVTVGGALTLGACATDGYYSGGYSTGYSSYYGYPSSSISLYYSSPRYYRYRYRGYHPRYRYYGRPYYRYRGGSHYRYRYRGGTRYRGSRRYSRPGYRPGRSGYRRGGRGVHRPGRR